MKQVIFMDGDPIQHPGEGGRELPIRNCDVFSELEAEKIYIFATQVEDFIHHLFRIQSLEEAYNELMDEYLHLTTTKHMDEIVEQNRLERRVRSYFLEADVFFIHWRRLLGRRYRKESSDPFKEVERKYKKNSTYALLRIVRNYLMHSGDIVHGVHIGINGEFAIWADVDLLIKDIRKDDDKKVLSGIGKQIDLIELASNSFPLIQQIHDSFLSSISDKDLISAIKNLIQMRNKILLYNRNDWYVIEWTGIEGVKPGLPIIGEVPGIGFNYRKLYWSAYADIFSKMKAKGIA